MKSSIAILLMICLQVAMSPLCLCYGAEVTEEVAPATCCHAPEGVDPAPCPHCDQELPITATAPVKGSFDSDPPEWNGLDVFLTTELPNLFATQFTDPDLGWILRDASPPPLASQAVLGVFLI